MWGFLLASLLVELTPGPNMTWLAVIGASQGRKVAFAAVAGIAIGLSVAGVVSALGLVVLFDLFPGLLTALRLAGTFYLLYLAYEAWAQVGRADMRGTETRSYFARGFVSNALNPKAYLFYASILPQFLSGIGNETREVAILTAVYVFVATVVHSGIAFLSGSLANWLGKARNAIAFQRLMAVAIAFVAIWFFYSTRQMGT